MIRVYDSGYRGPCRVERCEQIDAMSWLAKHCPERWPLIFHCPSETRANAQHMQMRAKEGVKPGIPDIIDFGQVRGAFELKRCDRTKSKVTAEQRAFLQAVSDSSGFAAICFGFEQFKQAYADYLEFVRAIG